MKVSMTCTALPASNRSPMRRGLKLNPLDYIISAFELQTDPR